VSHLIASGVFVVIDISYFEPASKNHQEPAACMHSQSTTAREQ
jgi:hypothetical protein